MENPATWGKAERVVSKIMKEFYSNLSLTCGLSLQRQITDALRKEGLLNEQPDTKEDGTDTEAERKSRPTTPGTRVS